ncbi:MAG: hypothetical protein CMO82_08360 [Winogradskyella sp.]|nr:hypothetical protein [Winogradskyella sp.]|tara:strand:+ start:7300 stop:8925 length:1626 start_codon:yes stop_codon:yes gene_type:complete
MKKLISIILIGIYFISLNDTLAQNQYTMEWSQENNSQVIPYTSDCANVFSYECQKIRLDSDNNVIVGGNSFESGNSNFLVIKYSNNGSLIWKQLIDISNQSDDYMTGIFIDNNNDIIVTGVSETSDQESKSVIIKLNDDGNILWESLYSNEYDWSVPQNLAIDSNGNIFLTGYVNWEWNSTEMFVCKFDSAGNYIWDYVHSSDNLSRHRGLTTKIIDNSIISLGFAYSTYPEPGNKLLILKHTLTGELISSSETSYEGNLIRSHIDNIGNSYIGMFGDFRLFKYDQLGNQEWVFEVTSDLPDNVTADQVHDIISDENGNIYITGRHYGEGYGTTNYTNADIQVNKISPQGDLIYNYRYENLGTNAADVGNKLFLGNNNYITVGGQSQDNLSGGYNYLAVVLDDLGEPIDTLRSQGLGGDSVIKSVTMDENLNLYVTGTGNGDTLTQKYSFSNTMNINEVPETEAKLKVYPNPFSNELKIITEDIQELSEFILFNLNGAIVYRKSIENESVLNFEAITIPKGLYFYKITYKNNFQFGKLIKE